MSWSTSSIDYTTLPAEMLAFTRQHLRVDFTDDDELIERYLGHAISLLEKFWGFAIFGATVAWSPEVSAGACAESPVRPVTNFTAEDSGGADVSGDYELNTRPMPAAPVFLCRRDGANFPAGLAVTLMAGYQDPARLDPAVETGILRVTGTLYEHRESVATLSVEEMPFWLNDLLGELWIPRA